MTAPSPSPGDGAAPPTAVAAAPIAAPSPRSADLVLARVHLRLGALALARAELETLAGRDGLDRDGLIDLAEVRWRTGDVVGAGEAAAAALEHGEPQLLALVVAAEAAMHRGRPTEARRHAEQALALGTGTVDVVFAGMPRAGVWPVDPMTPPPVATTLFDDPRGLAGAPAPAPFTPGTGAGSFGDAGADGISAGHGGDDSVPDPGTISLWAGTDDPAAAPPSLPAPELALEAARVALRDGRRGDAALAFGLVLRLAPALAPVVVAELGHDRGPELALTRGDAYRLVGREAEALRAFAEVLPRAADAAPPQPQRDAPRRPRPSPGPAPTKPPGEPS
jgi:hypothetical protein